MNSLPPGFQFPDDVSVMKRALALARTAQGRVEPNPCVGAVLVDDQLRLIGEGCHERYGGPHAEVMALRSAGERAQGATLYVTLEPCNHHGKTPPCTEAVVSSGIRRVVISVADPVHHVEQSGVQRLQQAGIDVVVGVCEDEGRELIAPFRTLMQLGRPFVHAKWAMTLDGRIATRIGSSKWISNPLSRARVHELRGRMDGIITGIGTVLKDDPLLTARPPGPRTPLRIILDSKARLPIGSQLVKTAREIPVLLVTTSLADQERCQVLQSHGVEILTIDDPQSERINLPELMNELGRRRMTNVLLEAGGEVLGSFHDHQLIDEVHCFIAPKIVGGVDAPGPVGGSGHEWMGDVAGLVSVEVEQLDDNVYLRGRFPRA